ncbi:MAG TPA: FAD-dependent oxidoreductase [Candidatus Dojkabacteria bacterium]|nr:FAD-dependent oxidoreductase [Candidatus Dojkabacteria bacterium]
MHDLIIVGAGPAGYTGAIYSARYGLDTLIIGEMVGGLASEAHKICNFPGSFETSGVELMFKFKDHVNKVGAKEINDRVEEITKMQDAEGKDIFTVKTNRSGEFTARAILLANGLKRRKLNLPNENQLYGRGLNYCATCDGPLYRGKSVTVIGGGDAATTAALFLSEIATEVHMIVWESELHGEMAWINAILNNKKVIPHYNSGVKELLGTDRFQGLITTRDEKVVTDGVFVEIGFIPDVSLATSLGVEIDERGYIIVNKDFSTNVKGVFAAGDATNGMNDFKQVLTACAGSAIAAQSIFLMIKQ